MGRIKDLTGQKFGRLKVISKEGNIGKQISWKCLCDCGNTKIVRGYSLRAGHTKSCGCLHSEIIREKLKTHGCCRLYRIWCHMKNRCYNPNDISYHLYGGRGIKICDSWLNSYDCFRKWAIENGYNENLSIDRINVDKDYEPSNCRWLTNKEQQNNRRNNCHITFNGETHTASEWSKITGISVSTIIWRKKHGWSDSDCIEKSVSNIV